MKPELKGIKGIQEVGQDLLETGRKIWLAGLGTVVVVEEESRSAFSALVKRGKGIEDRQRKRVEGAYTRANDQVRSLTTKVNQGVQDAMAATLHRFGVPTSADIQTLTARVEQLSMKVKTIGSAQ